MDVACERLQSEVVDVLTALEVPTAPTPSYPSVNEGGALPDVQPSSLLPPSHPNLQSYAQSLHAQLSSLSALLSTHFLRVSSLIEECHSLKSSSGTMEAMMAAMNEEERERREEIQQLQQQVRQQREEAVKKEEEWTSQVSAERLLTLKEREEVKRLEVQTMDLRDALRRMEGEREAERQRMRSRVDAESQCDGEGLGSSREGKGKGGSPSKDSDSPFRSPMRLHLRLPFSSDGSVSPHTPSSSVTLSVAAALAAADRGAGAKAAKGSQGALVRGKATPRSRAATHSPSPPSHSKGLRETEEVKRVKQWDGVPDF